MSVTRPGWRAGLGALLVVTVASLCLASYKSFGAPATDGGPAAVSEQAHDPAATTPASEPGQRTWDVGTRWRYDVELVQATSFPGSNGNSDDSVLTLTLRGAWDQAIVRKTTSSAQMVMRLVAPSLTMQMGDTPLPGSADNLSILEELTTPFTVELDARGRVTRVFLPGGVRPLVSGLLRSLVAGLQVADPPQRNSAAWKVTEHDTTGTYEATYRRENDGGAVTRTKLGYLELARASTTSHAPGEPAAAETVFVDDVEVDASARIDVDTDGWPQAVVGREALRLAGMFPVRTEATFSAHIQSVERDLALGALLAGVVPNAPGRSLSAFAASSSPETEHSLEMRAGTQSLEELLAAIDALAPGEDKTRRLHRAFDQMQAMLQLHPELVDEAVYRLPEVAPETARTVIAALAETGTEPALDALADVVFASELDPETRDMAVVHLGLADETTPAAVEALARSMNESDAPATSTLALGSVIATLSRANQSAADEAFALLERRLQAATAPADIVLIFEAMGNAGHPRALDIVPAYLEHEVAAVRVAAVEAVRFVNDSRADALIAERLAREPTINVRANIVREALRYRPHGPHLTLADHLLTHDTAPTVRLAVVHGLPGVDQVPVVAELCERVARDDPDPEVREAAQRIVEAS